MRHMSLLSHSQRQVGELVEREQELAALEAALTEASAGRPQVVFVTA